MATSTTNTSQTNAARMGSWLRSAAKAVDVAERAIRRAIDEEASVCTDGTEEPYKVPVQQNRHPAPTPKARKFAIGFNGDVGANEERDIKCTPLVGFRGERLSVSDLSAAHFTIVDIKTGKNSQFVTNNPLSAQCFSSKTGGGTANLDVTLDGQEIVLRVRNKSSDTRTFEAVLFGEVLE
jgi:hypothetical protein